MERLFAFSSAVAFGASFIENTNSLMEFVSAFMESVSLSSSSWMHWTPQAFLFDGMEYDSMSLSDPDEITMYSTFFVFAAFRFLEGGLSTVLLFLRLCSFFGPSSIPGDGPCEGATACACPCSFCSWESACDSLMILATLFFFGKNKSKGSVRLSN